jgi:peptidoglycan/LPS O-acetylase OafA/YrhL
MTKTESLYFDLSRIIAALFVLVGHVVQIMPGALPFRDWGHYAVDTFFVLSGYVISYVSDTKETSGNDYFVSRVARVYSVALPAVFLTVLCDFIGRHASGHAIYHAYPYDWPLVRIASGITFTSELWFESIQPLSNGPYWSLCYEVWYYAIFGAAFYLKGRARIFAVALLVISAGPKILLLFPIWLLGVALYHYKRVFSFSVGLTIFGLTVAGLVIIVHSELPSTIAAYTSAIFGLREYKLFEYSSNFPMDYLVAFLVAANYLAVRSLEGRLTYRPWVARAIRWAGGSTFSLYLFHRPLILMLASIFSVSFSLQNACFVVAFVIILVVLLSYATERRKLFWRKMVTFLLSRVKSFKHATQSSA